MHQTVVLPLALLIGFVVYLVPVHHSLYMLAERLRQLADN
jgi:uncharacterized membrane protein YiaA